MPAKSETLAGEVAIVTGGGRGIGLVIATALAHQGATVCLTGRNADHLMSAVSEIEKSGGRAFFAAGDVSDKTTMQDAVVKFRDQAGPASILVNNAGVGSGGPLAFADTDEWWRVMEVNVKGPMLMSHLVLPDMLKAGRGHIINMGSYVAITPAPMSSAYAASKAALLRLTDSIAAEVIDSGVAVLAVSPGWVWTDMTDRVEKEIRERNPDWEGVDPDYIFEPDAVSNLICRIVSGDADALFGRLLHVKDDLDGLVAQKDDIVAQNRLALRFDM